MRYAPILFLIFCCSCHYFEKKKLDSEKLLEEELQAFNWNALDQYPSFESCEDGIDFEANKNLKGSHISDETSARFKDALTKSFSALPVLYPAIKRSQHVQAVFQLPIILNAN